MKRRYILLITQQLKKSKKLFMVWSSVWLLLSILFAAVFKTMSVSADESAKIYASLPQAVLKTVNIPMDYLSSPEKFLSGQFLTVFLLAGSILAITISVHAIGGRIQDKTIIGLLTKDFSRPTLYAALAFALALVFVAMSFAAGISLYGMFALFSSATPSLMYICSLAVGAGILFMTFLGLGQLLGTVLQKPYALGAGYAFAIVSFFANGLGALAGAPAWIQKSSLYYYFDASALSQSNSLGVKVVVLVGLALLFTIVGMAAFRKKDIYV